MRRPGKNIGMNPELSPPGAPSPSATMPKITLASLDLFHVLNQAQYLQQVGALRGYYSTRLRPKVEKIQPELAHGFYPGHFILRLWQMYLQSSTGNHGYLQVCRLFDLWLRSVIEWDTDLLAILSGVGLKTFRAAQRRGIVTVVECGSTHTDFQHAILRDELRRNGISKPLFPQAYRDRVRDEFELADYIQLPSDFVIRTFVENGIDRKKLLLAPYGANLEVFQTKTEPAESRPFRVICPSGINLRKGARVLSEAWRKLNWPDAELVWIGSVTKETEHLFKPPLPGLRLESGRPHPQLAELYRSCDAFVLPSFEEGLARVLLEAASCGLPLIATPNTGVENFFTPGAPEGWLIPVNDVDALCEALTAAKSDRGKTFRLGQRAAQRSSTGFSWDDYGKRVLANYKAILGR
jgi:glycosyltransferase involved in cell wall biosynthesis